MEMLFSVGRENEISSEAVSDFDKVARRILAKKAGLTLEELVRSFLGQTWFQRLWIVQEMVLPNNLTLFNGTYHISGHDFMMAILVLRRFFVYGETWMLNPSALGGSRDLCIIRIRTHDHGEMYEESGILELVVCNSRRICKEPKDRIYALLGLQGVQSKELLRITPNYNVSDQDAFQQFATKLLQKGYVGCLHYAGHRIPGREHSNLPTWVPDWTCNQTCIDIQLGQSPNFQLNPFRACIDVKADIGFDNRNAAVVGIRGFLLDLVDVDVLLSGSASRVGICHHLEQCEDPWEQIASIQLWIGLCDDHCNGTIKYHTGEDIEVVIARTMVIDNHMAYHLLGKLDSTPGAKDGIVHGMRHLMGMKEHVQPCEDSKCAICSGADILAIFLKAIKMVGFLRTLFITHNGLIGLGPALLEPGDAVVVFYGAEAPFILRKVIPDTGESDAPEFGMDGRKMSAERWQLVGDCYLHGFMDNEILGSEFEGKDRLFWLV